MSIEADPDGTAGSGPDRQPAVQSVAQSVVTATSTGMPASADGTVALSAVDLTLSFGTRAILSNISVQVRRGAVTALIGPTGSGKTTLLRTFNRMNDKVVGYRHDGDVLLDGHSIFHPRIELMSLRRRVGMLFQRPNPFPMSIQDNVAAGARAAKLASKAGLREIAEKRLTEVGLWDAVRDRLKDSPFRLSGGQQQLLCLARALAVSPEVLLLDEPTSSLDPVATESIEKLVRTLTPDITVIIVTHNLAQASRIADRTIFLNAGRLVEHGDTRQLFDHPEHEETARYVGGHFG
jgi:phosphate transport system ATP-binding protein